MLIKSTVLAAGAFLATCIATAPGTSAAKDLFQFENFIPTNFSPFRENAGLEVMGSLLPSHLRALRRVRNESVTKKHKKRRDDDNDDNNDDNKDDDDKEDDTSLTKGQKTHNQEVEPSSGSEEDQIKQGKASKERDENNTIVDEPIVPNHEEEDVKPAKETEDEASKASKAAKIKTQTKKSKETPGDATVSDAGGVSTSDFLIYGILGVLVLLGIIIAVIYSRSHDRKDYTPIG
ncbi:hypothetical protein HJC23_012294 [Cyclotella cryptica]|uniref:Uncharacterized protein n=1 Tax=Cyclotella cryptica TaxID=29204 RepID=A0ABD3PKU1_9STRA